MHKILVYFFFVILFPVYIIAEEQKPTLKLGAILSQSGGLEQWCGYIQQGIELARTKPSSLNVQVIYADDRSAEKRAALLAIQKLTSADQVHFVYNWTNSTLPVIFPVTEQVKTPLLIAAYDPALHKQRDYLFSIVVNIDLLARDVAKFLVKKSKTKKVALLTAADDWSRSFIEPFTSELGKLSAELVFNEVILPKEFDTRSLILRLKKTNADAVFAPLYGSALYSFLKTVRELKFTGAIHVADGMFEEDIKIAGINAEGVYASQIWLKSKEFSDLYLQHFGGTINPLQLGLVATGYDWVRHVTKAAEQLVSSKQEVSGGSLNVILKSFKSMGYLGEHMIGAPPKSSGEEMVVVKDGRFILVE